MQVLLAQSTEELYVCFKIYFKIILTEMFPFIYTEIKTAACISSFLHNLLCAT